MVMYLRRFGVKEQIESLPLRLPKPNARAGPLCQKPATKDAPSASLEPIAPTHVKRKSGKRTICCALHPSASKPAGMHVSAMPLSEKEKRPRMIHSQLAECCMPLLEPFVGTSLHESIRGDLLPALPMAHLSPSIFFHSREGFLKDGSAPNACTANLFAALYPADRTPGSIFVSGCLQVHSRP